eukprot:gene17228-18949_t
MLPQTFDLHYVIPAGHHELLEAIVKAGIPNFQKDIDNCLAVSFRCDSSMDRTQKDNKFMLIKTIDKEGNKSLQYVGLGFVKEHGAEGHLEALKEGLTDTIGFDKLLQFASHLSTDGENNIQRCVQKVLCFRHNLKHKTKSAAIKIGDVVIVKNDKRKRGKWNLGILSSK